MEYSVEVFGETVELPPYTMKIDEQFDVMAKTVANPEITMRAKRKKMYDLLTQLLGKEFVDKHIGKFDDSDPNAIGIAYTKTYNAYQKPIEDYEAERLRDQIESSGINQISKVADKMAFLQKAAKK